MGIDACIYVKTTDGKAPCLSMFFPHEYDFEPWRTGMYGPQNAWRLSGLGRYYGPRYERGNWPELSAILLALYASPNVKTVYYFGDCDEIKEFTPEDRRAFDDHFMRNGNNYT